MGILVSVRAGRRTSKPAAAVSGRPSQGTGRLWPYIVAAGGACLVLVMLLVLALSGSDRVEAESPREPDAFSGAAAENNPAKGKQSPLPIEPPPPAEGGYASKEPPPVPKDTGVKKGDRPIEVRPEEKVVPYEVKEKKEEPREEAVTEVTLMGTKARGRRFCFIIDRSDSMSTLDATRGAIFTKKEAHDASLLGHAQRELKRTLESLKPQTQFYIIFFDSLVEEMPGKKWLRGGKEVEKVIPWMMGICDRDGTFVVPAFRKALQLDPPPDVIFLLTDGFLLPNDPAELARLNREPKKVPVHAFQLGVDVARVADIGPPNPAIRKLMQDTLAQRYRAAEALLKRIAKESGGTYRFVPVSGM
jgi:hypothetical protein